MIVSCGEALVDVLPDRGSVPGGGPMNAAVAAARLGAPAAFVGRVSTDADGDRIWAHLEDSGVVLSAAQRGPEPTARAIVELTPGPVFRFEGIGTADASMTGVDLSSLGPGPHLLHGGTLGIFRGTTARVLGDLVAGHDGIVSFDPNVRPQVLDDHQQWYRHADTWLDRADLVKASDEDLDWMGLTPAGLLGRGASVVLRTLGGDGVEAHLAGGEVVPVPAAPVDVVDAVGAGDSFSGAVLTWLWEAAVSTPAALAALDAEDWRRVLRFAAAVAGITVGRAGADPPRRYELPEQFQESAGSGDR
jgi:fructokinase